MPTTPFALLKVVDATDIGCFLDQGQDKDLFLPRSEEYADVRIGDMVVVAIYEDKQGRPCSSMRLDKFTNKDITGLTPGQQVDIIIYANTDLGFKALINKEFAGLLYNNEVFQKLSYGENLKAYVKAVRPDGKVDLVLQPFGNLGADDLGLKIIEALEDAGGFLAVNDKTDAEVIYKMFGVSKKKFKIALGAIYKKRLITVDDKGIKLV